MTATAPAAVRVVGYPGPEGTHSDAAATILAPAGAATIGLPTFTAVIEATTSAEVGLGVLPIESSLVGPIAETHDLLYRAPLSIVREATLPIRHCLLGLAGTRIEDVRVVRSHPAALDQCRALLARLSVESVPAATTAEAARAIEQIFRDAGASTARVALDEHTETELWELRHAASPILSRLDANLKSMQFIEDCAVPPENLPAYVRGIREILARHETRVVIFGHAGDCHVHVNPLVDVRRPDWRARVESILGEVVALAARLGGTLAGEHGDGRLRAPLLPAVWSTSAMQQFRRVKEAFDPDGILNPGAKLAVPGERPIGDVKYDPSAPPLPSRARAALDRVERKRDYARFRLELLDEDAAPA